MKLVKIRVHEEVIENMQAAGAGLTVLFMLIWLGIVVYMVSLAVRFVKAVETIADKMK